MDPGLPYAERYAALFATAPKPLGLMKKIEAAAMTSGHRHGDMFAGIFSCHDDDELEKRVTAVEAKLDLMRQPPVAEMKEDGFLGVHHFISVPRLQFRRPILMIPLTVSTARVFGPGTDESARAGCDAFESRVGSSVRAVRQCMIDALAPSIQLLADTEWSHAKNSKLPERESPSKDPLSPLRGLWRSRKCLPQPCLSCSASYATKLSWMSWNGAWSIRIHNKWTRRKAELDAWTGVRPSSGCASSNIASYGIAWPNERQ